LFLKLENAFEKQGKQVASLRSSLLNNFFQIEV